MPSSRGLCRYRTTQPHTSGSPSRHPLHARSHVSMLHVQGRSADPDYELPDSEQRSAATASTLCHGLNPLAAVRLGSALGWPPSLTARSVACPDRLMEQRILKVGRALVPLHGVLEQVVADTPWIDKYGMGDQYGMGDVANPYVRACRAECMLAVLMLHLERVEVNFIDSDRLEVLRDAPSSASLQAVREAVVDPA